MVDVRNNIIWTLRDEVSGTARKLNGTLDGLGVKSKSATGIVGKLGNVTGGLVTPFSLGAAAALAVGAGIVESTKAAIAEEKNIAKLSAALYANIPAWDGNTSAIEATIKQREKLAFSDDDLRNSLALLVGATHDVTKAQQLQLTAMDLARFKNISLDEASTALIRTEGGQYRMLKSLGIVLKEGATSTDALAAVQKVAAGQAQKYGDTTEGAMESAQIALNDVSEELGTVFTPAVHDAAIYLRDDLIPALEDTAAAFAPIVGPLADLATGLHSVNPAGNEVISTFKDLQKQADELGVPLSGLADKLYTMGESARAGAYDGTKALGAMGQATDDLAGTVQQNSRDIRGYFNDMTQAIAGDVESLIDNAFNPIELGYDRVAQHAQINKDIQTLANAKNKKDSHDATVAIVDDLDTQASTLVALGRQHNLTKSTVDQYESDVTAAYKAMGKKVPPSIQAVIDRLRTLESYDGDHVGVGVDIYQNWKSTTQTGKHAGRHAGGFVGMTDGPTMTDVGWMGEAGTEAYAILKNPKPISGSGMGSPMGSSPTINLTYAPQFSTASVTEAQRFMRAIIPELTRELRRQGAA